MAHESGLEPLQFSFKNYFLLPVLTVKKSGAPPRRSSSRQEKFEPPVLKLRDKIPRGVHSIFVGINPGTRSATIGHYYAGHSNSFWKLLHESGIWPNRITTKEDDLIVQAGFGLTDVVKRPTNGLGDLAWAEFSESRARISKIAARHQPKWVIFVGKTAARAFLENNQADVAYGIQAWKVGQSKVFVLPSTSGASMGHTSYAQKLDSFRQLAREIGEYVPKSRRRPSRPTKL